MNILSDQIMATVYELKSRAECQQTFSEALFVSYTCLPEEESCERSAFHRPTGEPLMWTLCWFSSLAEAASQL